jgi:hypothetical protein
VGLQFDYRVGDNINLMTQIVAEGSVEKYWMRMILTARHNRYAPLKLMMLRPWWRKPSDGRFLYLQQQSG